jgi:hypothetical protein
MPLTVRGGTGSRLAGGCASAGWRDGQPTHSRRPAGLQVGPAEFQALQVTRDDPRSTVTENDRTRHSGSRWEPAAASPAADPLVDQPPPGGTPGEPPLLPSAAAEQAPPTFAEPAPPARRPRGRAGLAAAAVGLVLAGGVGGFALGNATGANGSTQPGPAGTGVPGDHGDHDGLPGGRTGVGGGPGVPPDLGDGPGSATGDQSDVQS